MSCTTMGIPDGDMIFIIVYIVAIHGALNPVRLPEKSKFSAIGRTVVFGILFLFTVIVLSEALRKEGYVLEQHLMYAHFIISYLAFLNSIHFGGKRTFSFLLPLMFLNTFLFLAALVTFFIWVGF